MCQQKPLVQIQLYWQVFMFVEIVLLAYKIQLCCIAEMVVQLYIQEQTIFFKSVYLYYYISKDWEPAQLTTATHELWETWATALVCDHIQLSLTPKGYHLLSSVWRGKCLLFLGCSKLWSTAFTEDLNMWDCEWEKTQMGAHPLLLILTMSQLWSEGQSRQLEAITS